MEALKALRPEFVLHFFPEGPGCRQTRSWLREPAAISLPKPGKQYLSSSQWDTQETSSPFLCP